MNLQSVINNLIYLTTQPDEFMIKTQNEVETSVSNNVYA